MKRKNEKGNESSRLLLLSFTHVFVRTPVVPSTVPFRTPGTVPNAVRKISPRSSGRTERAAEIESITSEAAVRLFLRRFIWARHSSVLQTRKETSYFSCVSRYFPWLFLTVTAFSFRSISSWLELSVRCLKQLRYTCTRLSLNGAPPSRGKRETGTRQDQGN